MSDEIEGEVLREREWSRGGRGSGGTSKGERSNNTEVQAQSSRSYTRAHLALPSPCRRRCCVFVYQRWRPLRNR